MLKLFRYQLKVFIHAGHMWLYIEVIHITIVYTVRFIYF